MEKRDADLLLENFRLALKFIEMNNADHIKCKFDNVLKNISDLRIGQVISNWGKIKKLAEDVITNFDKISKNDPCHLFHIENILESCKDLNFFEIVGLNSTSQVSVSVDQKAFQMELSCIQLELQNLFQKLPLLESNFYMIFNFIFMYLFY